MGVLGLWQLLAPVGQPVALESLENKIFAVDISIWLNQAIKGYRDSQGGALPNAHLLSLFSRLCKLLFYKIRPIIVFDGGFPELKKQTIISRQNRRLAVKQSSNDIGMKILHNYIASQNLAKGCGEPSGKVTIKPKEKARDEIYQLPPLPDTFKDSYSYSESTEDNKDWKFTNFSKEDIKYLNTIDIESDDFNDLPPDVKNEILSTLKESRKRRTWEQMQELPENSNEFSNYQMQSLLKKRNISKKIEQVQKDMREVSAVDIVSQYTSDHVVGETNKIMSDDISHYVLFKKIVRPFDFKSPAEASADASSSLIETKNAFMKDMENIDVDDLDNIHEEDIDDPSKKNPLWVDKPTNIHQSASKDPALPSKEEIKEMEKRVCDYLRESLSEGISFEGLPSPRKNPHVCTCFGESSDSSIYKDQSLSESDFENSNKSLPKYKGHWATEEFFDNEIETDPAIEAMADAAVQYYKDHVMSQESPKVAKEFLDKESTTCSLNGSSRNSSTESTNKSKVSTTHSSRKSSTESSSESASESSKDSGSQDEELKVVPQGLPHHNVASPECQEKELDDESSSDDEMIPCEEIPAESLFIRHYDNSNLDKVENYVPEKNDNSQTKIEVKNDVPEDTKPNIECTETPLKHVDLKTGAGNIPMASTSKVMETPLKHVDVKTGADPIHLPSTSKDQPIEPSPETIRRNLELQENINAATLLLEADQAKLDRQNRTVQDHMVEDCKELLRLFGIPFIVSPTEAEAQCAFFDLENLTHGTITDDSDVWLFGGKRVYKNFFSQDKYVEFYKDHEIFAHFGLSRQKLVHFAMLTGSDYTDGIEGVGRVTAMEIISEFPGDDIEALRNFREWWTRCNRQSHPPENKVRAKLLKLVLKEGFPDEKIAEAYLNPDIDQSTEKFSWGRPDLDALRDYTRERFGWSKSKVDEALLPVIKKLRERDSQTHLDSFFTVSLKKQTELFPSKRIMSALKKITSPQKDGSAATQPPETKKKPASKKVATGRKRKTAAAKKVVKRKAVCRSNQSKPQEPVLSEESSDES